MSRASKSAVFFCVVLLSGYPSVFAQVLGFDALQGMGETRYHRIDYLPLDQTYHIYVRLPEEYEQAQEYPAVYLLDGGTTFPMLGAYYHYLRYAEEIPPMIVVGISYGTDDWQNGNNRGRDFTARAPDREHWGGAARFVSFFRNTLFPLIEKNYAADSTRRIIFGQSLGGQFVLFAAHTETNLFWGHIASNPALHRNLDFFLETRPESALKSSSVRLLVASASEDDPRFREPALKWMQFWREQSDIPWELKVLTLQEQNHFSAAPEAFRQGLRWIFNPQ